MAVCNEVFCERLPSANRHSIANGASISSEVFPVQTHPPVGITHCCSSYFTHVPRQARESRKSLPDVVIVRTNVLQIYRVRYFLSVLKAWLYIDLLRALLDITKAEAACV